jgi:hypothetical protein
MKEISITLLLMFALCEIASGQSTQNRSAVKCAEDSPERRGEEGCTILASISIVSIRWKTRRKLPVPIVLRLKRTAVCGS